MQVISDKDLNKKKKPVQVYFDTETLLYVQAKLGKSNVKMSMAEYIRVLVKKDLESEKIKSKKRKWETIDLGLNISSDPREIDKIAYGI